MAEDRKINEMDIFKKWRQTGHKQYFQELYSSMKPLIYSAAQKASYGSNVPESAHKIYAAQNFLDALRTFDPKSGAALQTHVYGSVHQKAKRLNYLYQDLGHKPEPRAQAVGVFQSEHQTLRAELGREPSAAELADKLGWGIKQVTSIQKELRKDLAIGEGTEEMAFAEGSKEEEVLNYLYYELNNEQRVVYDYIFGKHGKPRYVKQNNRVDYDRIAKDVGMSVSKARSLAQQLGKKLEVALKK